MALPPSFRSSIRPAHCLVSGTGLTHKASAKNRAAMHKTVDAEATDSFRMFKLGLEGGIPPQAKSGFSLNGSIRVMAPF